MDEEEKRDDRPAYVTNSQLNDKLEKMRWELRCMVLAAVVLGPTGVHLIGTNVANAASSLF